MRERHTQVREVHTHTHLRDTLLRHKRDTHKKEGERNTHTSERERYTQVRGKKKHK